MAKENAKNIGKETKKRNLAAQQPNKKKTSVKDYFKGIRIEMKKVVWPTKKELGSYTAVVVLTCAFFALAFWAIDSGFLALLKAVLNIEL
ncbi:MAG: preprotein translocase subunit SecE [Eubacteriales bacterium]|nr:preprotein translocase subunit SecE [Clostridiales bacterium]MDD7307243.1 preprotein translocase subunit SecE [Eubacteriales bacterium]MDY2932792.1 preprotein translocase subunit SecE [Anaerovoracaceae bacterium]MEE0182479.1 preprotein translocase subunit SecE [Anaerovoracaceae bacterium]